jgi:hypothetical protein
MRGVSLTNAALFFPKAPKDNTKSPYRNGTFLLTCDIPQTYPRDPPEIRFVTFILHPNVSGLPWRYVCQHSHRPNIKVSKQGKVSESFDPACMIV